MTRLMAVLLTLLANLSQAAEEPNLVANPGFETPAADGKPIGWSLPAGYAASTEQPRSGSTCLKYTNTDPEVYRLCTQSVRLQPGLQYELSAWVRTAGVEGKESGATICAEWSGDGKYLGGTYPGGFSGTNDTWREIRTLVGPVPAAATSFNITCYLRRGMTGTAWFDDVSLTRYRPPLLAGLDTNAYRNLVAGGMVTVRSGLNLAPNDVTAEQVTAELAVLDAQGRPAHRAGAPQVTSEAVTWQLDASGWAPGDYQLRARVKAGELSDEATAKLSRVTSLADRKAWIDQRQRLILDGEPFFPLGTYWSAVNPADVELYAKSPFNCLMPYNGASREMLDLLDAKGLKIIYSVKDLYHGTTHSPKELQSVEDERQAIEKVVAEKGDHPAIMAWYINDELPQTMLPQLTAHRDWMEELDPGRPTWVVLYQVNQVRHYLPTFDVIGTDPYPIPSRPASMALDWTRQTREAVFGNRAVWQVPQIFDWATYHDDREQRPPTYAEMRSMAWSCIAAGANGLVFYSFFDLQRMDKTKEQGGRAKVREPFDERWAEVCRMAQQIKDQTPILLAAEPAPGFTLTGPEEVACRVWRKDGVTWLLAVNAAVGPAEATVTFDEGFKTAVEVLPEEDGSVAVTGKVVKLTFPGLGVQMVRLAN